MTDKNLKPKIYCVSGLGADERVFQKLKFEGYNPVHINWLEPEKKETIADYAQRLTAQINSEKPIIIGLSFGGIIAIEIAKQIETEKIILISSIKNQQEIPFYFQILRWFPIHRSIPAKIILCLGQLLAAWFFSLNTIAERKLFRAIVQDTDAKFMKWAIDRLVLWKNEIIPQNLYHIHGESDRIFPYRFVREDFNVGQGGHLMILNQAEHISLLIQKIINLD